MYEMNEEYLEDYTIKEIYMNFPFFEEKFQSIINAQEFRVLHKNEFYSKLKFVKALNEYRNSLYLMPYVHKYADGMVDRILTSVNSVKTMDLDENLTYDLKSGEFIFNRNSTETLIFDDLMEQFTDIALKDVHTEYKDEVGSIVRCDGFDKARIEYIANELKNIRRNKQYTGYTEVKTQGSSNAQIFERLVKVFGAEKMLTLNSSNIQTLSKDFHERGESLDSFMKQLNIMNEANLSSDYRQIANTELNNVLVSIERGKEQTNTGIENETTQESKEDTKKENKIIAWFKSFKNKLGNIFFFDKNKKQLLLNNSQSNQSVNGDASVKNSTETHKTVEFTESIQVDTHKLMNGKNNPKKEIGQDERVGER